MSRSVCCCCLPHHLRRCRCHLSEIWYCPNARAESSGVDVISREAASRRSRWQLHGLPLQERRPLPQDFAVDLLCVCHSVKMPVVVKHNAARVQSQATSDADAHLQRTAAWRIGPRPRPAAAPVRQQSQRTPKRNGALAHTHQTSHSGALRVGGERWEHAVGVEGVPDDLAQVVVEEVAVQRHERAHAARIYCVCGLIRPQPRSAEYRDGYARYPSTKGPDPAGDVNSTTATNLGNSRKSWNRREEGNKRGEDTMPRMTVDTPLKGSSAMQELIEQHER